MEIPAFDPPPYSARSQEGDRASQWRGVEGQSGEFSGLPPYSGQGNEPTAVNEMNSRAIMGPRDAAVTPSGSFRGGECRPSDASASPSAPAGLHLHGEESTSSSAVSFIQKAKASYSEKRKAKEAAKKVDFYEKMYGFVPKNVMSEAEWKKAREKAPKAKAKVSLEARPWMMGRNQ